MNAINHAGYGQKLYEILLRCNIASIYSIEGCREDEVETVRLHNKVNFLPQIYREFLRTMGRQAGNLYRGLDYDFRSAQFIKERVNDELEMFGRTFRIPKDAVAFLDHGGSGIWYFHTEESNDDPAIYLYDESEGSGKIVADHLSQFLEESIREYSESCS